MRILHISTGDWQGGAARAAARLHEALLFKGVDSHMYVRDNNSPLANVHTRKGSAVVKGLRPYLERLPVLAYRRRGSQVFSVGWQRGGLALAIKEIRPDLVHLHWLGGGFGSLGELGRLGPPVVWTLHDSWPFTGGCHVPGDCEGFERSCGSCPALGSSYGWDLSYANIARKRKLWRHFHPYMIAPGNWIAELCRKSSLFGGESISVIPHGVDTDRFSPGSRLDARRILGLPQGRTLIGFGSVSGTSDPNKGYALLLRALQNQDLQQDPKVSLVVFGSKPSSSVPFGFPVHWIGGLGDEASLVLLYRAVDVVAVPSRQETFSLVSLEAQACGTPVVAFDRTGPADIILHRETGYLARSYDPVDFGKCLSMAISSHSRTTSLGKKARKRITATFSSDRWAVRHVRLYGKLLASGE